MTKADGVDYVDPPAAPLLDRAELRRWSFYRAVIAEFMATLLFLYVAVATVIGQLKQENKCDGVGTLGIAWAFLSLVRAVSYAVAQCLGAVCGAGLAKSIMKRPYNSLGGDANLVQPGYSTGAALGAEIVGTFLLVYTVFSATDPKRKARDSHVLVLAPLPIGFAVFLAHLATIPITGTGINPARSFGTAVIYNQKAAWDDQWIFWIGPLTGAAIAAGYHQYVLRALAMKALSSLRSTT
ncbi:unnamed protein product [Spirodela intermedia]|uniref:Uncharacterized protein n=1 Tax=Spirodela intermedia TaxID=51605 RepID=A0A7I8JH60_SPIIN|nr:unnamed protein product [Spirodela intermedia]CAA6668883.1 unnamed protein product [Spirodela intermedia]